MNWSRSGNGLLVSDAGYYIVGHKMRGGYWYNAWKGDPKYREFREYVNAGSDVELAKQACADHEVLRTKA